MKKARMLADQQSLAGETEGGRSPTGVSPAKAGPPAPGVAALQVGPDPAVLEKPDRRRFTAEYKLRVLQEADRCTQPGELGALLRREGLYSSHLANWRHLRNDGALSGLGKRRGRKPDPNAALVAENERLKRQAQRLEAKLHQAETIIEVQKKLSEIWGIQLPPTDSIERTP
jgi:transposase